MLIAGVDAGVAIDDLVVGPLRGSPPNVEAALRGAVVITVVVVCVARLLRWPAPAGPCLAAPADELERLDEAEALRASLASLPPITDELPATLAVHVGAALIEVFWGGPLPPPPAPWRSSATGWVWEASRGQLLPCRTLDRRRWALLVLVGETPTGTLWLNLAAFRVVALAGDDAAVRRRAATIVRALRRRADSGAVELVAPDDPGPDAGPTAGPGVVERALAVLWQHTARRRAEAGPQRRVRRRAQEADRLVVVAPAEPGLRGLLARARSDPGATVVVIGDDDGADLRLHCSDGNVTVPFLGDIALRVDDPVPCEERPTKPPASAIEEEARPPSIQDRPSTDGAEIVEVGLLGPVEVRGAAGALAGKSLELVVYLACHPHGASDEQIRAALWPDRAPAAATWAQRVSVTRRALGKDPDGSPRLLRFRRHVGQLSPSVRTDVSQLDAALARCRDDAEPSAAAIDSLASLLDGIRGQPFDTPRAYGWADEEGHVRHAEQSVTDAAHYLAERAIAAGDWERALWSSERGLRACPTSDVLLADRRQAMDAGGVSTGELATRALREALRDLDPRLGLTGPDPDPDASRVTVVDS